LAGPAAPALQSLSAAGCAPVKPVPSSCPELALLARDTPSPNLCFLVSQLILFCLCRVLPRMRACALGGGRAAARDAQQAGEEGQGGQPCLQALRQRLHHQGFRWVHTRVAPAAWLRGRASDCLSRCLLLVLAVSWVLTFPCCSALALRDHPDVNSSWMADSIRYCIFRMRLSHPTLTMLSVGT
jgi:hypothetical protein